MKISDEMAKALLTVEAGKQWSERAEKWKGQRYNIFISCSDSDREVAGQVSAILGGMCVDHFFYLKDMNWGDEILERVKEAIAQCTHLLLIATTNSQGSEWVTYELGQADALGKGVLTFVPDSTLQLGDVLKRHHYVTTLEAIREFFSRPSISPDALDDFLAEVLGELPAPITQFVPQGPGSDSESLVWRTPKVPPEAKRGCTILIAGAQDDPRVEVRTWTAGGAKEEFRLEFADAHRAVRLTLLHGSPRDRGILLNRDEPILQRLKSGDKFGWKTDRAFWIEAVTRLRRLLGVAQDVGAAG